MATQDQIEYLKSQWVADPCWDIWNTEGFEEHEAELRAYQVEQEKLWNEQYNQKLLDKAESIGVPGNMVLAEAFMRLEEKIEKLATNLEKLEMKQAVRETVKVYRGG